MTTFFNDLKYSIRQLIKSPGFTCMAVLTLALGIGACTAMFSLVNAVLLRSLPFHEPDRLVWMQNKLDLQGDLLSYLTLRVDNFVDYRNQARSFKDMAAYHAFFEWTRYTLTGTGESQRLRGIQVSQNFLDVLGIQPFLGRNFVDEECTWSERPGAEYPWIGRLQAAILSHAFWQQKFGGAMDVIGQSMTINGESVKIVGVLPPSAHLDILFSPGTKVELLLPYPLTEETARQGNTLFAIGRLKSGVTLAQAQEELNVINARLNDLYPDRVRQGGQFRVHLRPLEDQIRGSFRPAFLLLLGAVLCVLLIACVNLSNLLLARTNERQREFSVRLALGASRWHLVRQMMTESLCLAVTGCVLGAVGASLVLSPLARLEVFNIPLLSTVSIDTTSLIITVGLACLTALLCSSLPAFQLWHRKANEVNRESGTRTSIGRNTAWMRRTLVVSEISLASILLVGAGLLTRSFVKVLHVDLGFQSEHVSTWRVDTTHVSSQEILSYYDRLIERVSSVPGVESVGLSDSRPLGFERPWALQIQGGENSLAYVRMVDHRCLPTMRINLHRGRYFDDRDTVDSQKVMMISETMARSLWPDQNPIGKKASMNGAECTVVGVVSDVAHGLEEDSQSDMYLNMRQWDDNMWWAPELVVRSNRAPATLVPDVRAIIRTFDPMLASNEFAQLDDIVDRAIAPRRLITGILGSFSSVAFLLAILGLYGVVAYSVGQRTQEIGIRQALGARRGDVMRLIIKEGLRLVGVGIAVGLIVAFFVTRVLQSQLYGVTTSDPLTYATTALVLVIVTLLACTIPARRATKIDPMEALRYE